MTRCATKSGDDIIGRRLGLAACVTKPTWFMVYPVNPSDTEEQDQWTTEQVEWCNHLCVQQLTCRAISSSSTELVVRCLLL